MKDIVLRIFCDSTCGYLRGMRIGDEICVVAQDVTKGLGYAAQPELPGSEMTVFENADFGRLRTVTENGETWFVGKDVAEALGYSNSVTP